MNALLSSMFALSIVSCCFEHNLSNHVRFRSLSVVSTKRRRRSRVVVNFRLILSQCVFISVLCAFSCNLIRVLTWRKTKCNSINWICGSTLRIWCEVVLKTSQIIRSFVFCSSMISFVSLFDVFDFSCEACYVLDSYVIIDRTTMIYTCLVFLKQASHVNAMSWERANICVVIFFWIFRTCDFHLSLMFIWILNILIEIVDFLITLLILMNAVILNLRWFCVKCINSYLIDAKRTSCRLVHSSHSSCVCFSALQLLFVLISYIKMLMSFTKSIIVILCLDFFNDSKIFML